MADETEQTTKKSKNWCKPGNGGRNAGGPWGFVLFVAFIGAVIYFVQQSHGFWGFILAILKAAVWPAYVMYHILQNLHI